ncbi:hypothetical protein D3C81_1154220 [compost metagenome]
MSVRCDRRSARRNSSRSRRATGRRRDCPDRSGHGYCAGCRPVCSCERDVAADTSGGSATRHRWHMTRLIHSQGPGAAGRPDRGCLPIRRGKPRQNQYRRRSGRLRKRASPAASAEPPALHADRRRSPPPRPAVGAPDGPRPGAGARPGTSGQTRTSGTAAGLGYKAVAAHDVRMEDGSYERIGTGRDGVSRWGVPKAGACHERELTSSTGEMPASGCVR